MPLAQSRVSHIVVLMLENRTFDHIFGFRKNVDGLTGNEFNLQDPSQPVSTASNPKFVVDESQPYSTLPSKGPGHELGDTNIQLTNDPQGPRAGHPATNNGFVSNFPKWLGIDKVKPTPKLLQLPMSSLSPDKVPAIHALADAFLLCDNWFAEVPGPTQPNRLFMHAGTSFGHANNEFNKKPPPTFDGKTIYGNVQRAGGTWAVYYHDAKDIDVFNEINTEKANIKLFGKSFAKDVAAGHLANYVFIVPRMFNAHGALANSQHAPEDVRHGDNLIADVYGILRGNAGVWNKTALIVTYDEHGGFYDHVIPPDAGVSNPDSIDSPPHDDPTSPPFKFDRLGLRVPAIIASPWVSPGVDHARYQHTSVLATAKKLWQLPDFLTARDRSAASFEGVFQKLAAARTDTPPTLPKATLPPEPPATSTEHPGNQPLDDNQRAYLHRVYHLTQDQHKNALTVDKLPTTQHEASEFMKRRYAGLP
jgi:phospholipase C